MSDAKTSQLWDSNQAFASRGQVRTDAVGQQLFTWPSTLLHPLQAFSASEGVSLFTTVLAGFETLLHRYTGQNEFFIRCFVAERINEERDRSLDPVADVVRIPGDFRSSPSFRDVITRLRDVMLRSRERTFEQPHEQLDSDNVVGLARFPRALFVAAPPGSTNDILPLLQWDLCLAVSIDGDGLTGTWTYSTTLFDEECIHRMIGHLQMLLAGAVQNPNEGVSLLPMLTEVERQQILVEWNNTGCSYAEEKCIHELFEAQVERSPDRIAAVFNGVELSYRELNARANQLAHHLQELGAQPGSVIGLHVGGPLEQIVGLFGILKTGAAYVPLDPAYPKERLKAMLHDAEVPLLVTQKHLLADVPAEPWQQVVSLDGGWTEDGTQSRSNLDDVATPDGVAYVLYTSGSTGAPKGIPITHRSVVNFLDSMQRELQLTPADRVLAVTTINFDMAILEIYLPLMVGASVCLVARATAIDGVAMAERASDSRITLMQATPATWQLLLEAGWVGNRRLKAISGGEAMPRELAATLLSKCASVWNGYGPTETTVYASVFKIDRVDPERVPIGRPTGNTQLYILDRHLQPRPVGIPGEIYIGGVGVAKGYLNRPELTAEAFIPDVFSHKSGRRLYKTGDYGRYRADGNIEYLGRIDHQVKIAGFRIELDEIESALRQHPAVHDAVVLAREEVPGNKRLVAYIVAKQATQPTATNLRRHLQAALPHYMVPSAYVFLRALPLTPNGKVDRQALPSPESTHPRIEEDYVAPRNDTERRLAVAWETVLRRRPIGTRDDFFSLGGDSLLALRLVREIETTFGRKLPSAVLYQAPTIEQLANLLGRDVVSTSFVIPIQPAGSKPPLFWFWVELTQSVRRYLDEDQPLYAILHQGDDGHPARYTTVEAMANLYSAEIRRVQPRGPYYLGGYCFGAIVAFETAQRLQKDGDSVDLLAMLDPDDLTHPQRDVAHTSRSPRAARPRESYRDRMRRHLKYGISPVRFVRYATAMVKTAFCNVCFGLGCRLPAPLIPRYMLRMYAAAMARYVPEPYSGRTLIWRSTENTCDSGVLKNLFQQVEIDQIDDARHSEVLQEPQARAWAERLAQELRGLGSRVHVSDNVNCALGLVASLHGLASCLSPCAF